MRILLICASYSPRSSSPAFRTTNIAKALEEKNKVFVLTYSEAFQLRLDKRDEQLVQKEIHAECIHRISQVVSKSKEKNQLLKEVLYKHGVANLLFPDPHIKNCYKFYKKAKELIKKEKIDTVVTYSFPHSFHVIGYYLKKKIPNIKWVLDYGDIWYGAPFEEFKKVRLKKKLDFLIEKKILKKADMVSLTTQSSIDFYRRIFKIDKFCLTEMGHNPKSDTYTPNFKDNTLKIIHAGRLYYPMRDPIPLIQFLEKSQENIELILIGALDTYLKTEIHKINPQKTILKSWMTSVELEKEVTNSHVLILFGNQSELQVPGKIYEYLSYGIPIIYIHHNLKNDPVIQIAKKYNFVYSISNTKVEEEFSDIMDKLKVNIENNISSNYEGYYGWKNIGNRFNKSLEGLHE